MPWIYKTRRNSPANSTTTGMVGIQPVANLRTRLTKGNLIVDVGWSRGFNPHQCISRPWQGICTGGVKPEFYARRPLYIIAQQYYFDGIKKKGYWYQYNFEGSTGATYDAWFAAANAATNSSNVRWRNNGKASGPVQAETLERAAANTRPVLLRLIAEKIQTSASERREEFARQTKRERGKIEPDAAVGFPWIPVAVVGTGVLLYLRR